jgi:pimeloyl-ACP methyl ester carboxylesterase
MNITNTPRIVSGLTLLCLLITQLTLAQKSIKHTSKFASLKTAGIAPVNGLKMYYEVHGAGAPVVLLHGSYMTIDLNWAELIPELAKKHQVIAIEMQGHGRTSDIARKPSYTNLANDLFELLKYLKIDKASLIGYSMGGTVAMQFAILHPAQLDKLIILSTVSKHNGWSKATRDVLASMKPEFLHETPLKTEYDRLAPRAADWDQTVRKYIAFDNENFDLGNDNIRGIHAPVLLIMGDNDGVTLAHKMELYKLLGGDVFADIAPMPRSLLAIFPGSGHVGLMMQTEKILNTMLPFLSNQPFIPASDH